MSRRSLIPHTASQARAASRMTVGTRMWSEQPNQVPAVHRKAAAEPEVAAPAQADDEVESP